MMSTRRNHFLKLILGLWLLLPAIGRAAELRQVDSPYYVIWTDLPDDVAREASLRMTRMAEEYAKRTRDFSGTISQRMPFYLFAHDEDYLKMGGPAESAGYFDGKNLVARASHLDDRTWHTVQHEGFHQFAHGTIRGSLPTWADEGLAEYFGEAVWTGDGFVAGVIPQWRMQRIRQTMQANKFASLPIMMGMSLPEWNANLSVANYDEGWSMVQFLAHGENGKYQRPFGAFISEINNTQSWQAAWADSFGSIEGFEQRWKAYWMSLPDAPTLDLYAQAQVEIYTSFLARAIAQKQTFASFEEFLAAAKQKKLLCSSEDWLPTSLLGAAVKRQDEFDQMRCVFAITPVKGERFPRLTCKLPGGQIIVGKFMLRGDRVASVAAVNAVQGRR